MSEIKNQAWDISLARRILWLLLSFAGGTLYAAALPPLNWSFAVFFSLLPVLHCAAKFKWKFILASAWCWGVGWALFSYQFLREIEWFVPYLLAPVMALWPVLWAAGLPKLRQWLLFPAGAVLWNVEEKKRYLDSEIPWYRVLCFSIVSAALFTLVEWSRSRLFVWNDFSVTQWRNLAFIQISAVTGSYGVGFLVAWCNTAIYGLIGFRRKSGIIQMIPPVLCIAGVLFYGHCRLKALEKMPPPERILRAGLVQCDLSQRRHASEDQIVEAVTVCTALSRELAAKKPDLIIWPESAVPVPLTSAGSAGELFRREFSALLRDTAVPHLAGMLAFKRSPDEKEWQITNSAVFFDPAKRGVERYDKIHRVPFGEYVPFRRFLPQALIDAVDMGRDLAPGNNFEPLNIAPGVRASVAVCYEGVFGYLIRKFALRNSNLLIVISNDAWYPESSEPEQHLANAVIRCVESGLNMIRCGNNGGSGVVTSGGRFTQYIGSAAARPELLRERAAGIVEIPVYSSNPVKTIYLEYGEWFIFLLWIIIFAVIVYGMTWEHRRLNAAAKLSGENFKNEY